MQDDKILKKADFYVKQQRIGCKSVHNRKQNYNPPPSKFN